MKCPTDETTLVMSERSGIEIDYCPTCRGVWLDRGELDKILERSVTAPAPTQAPTYQERATNYQDRNQQYAKPGYDEYGRKRRKESWLSELFD